MAADPQNFQNHAKFVPAFHFLTMPLLLAGLVYFGLRAVQAPSTDTILPALFALGVMLAGFFARLFALGVQDRVIRLEERLRMEAVLPPEQRPRIHEITTDQLIGLRFASDEELPALTARVLAGELEGRKEIKAAVREWRADHQRI